ncbi:amino acid ABC transporter permease [Poseidonocella sp. HB161398]|uniref:amino acid ABC transporter permease n=1 Tax=Poseidonocella sp. HB161398 TaxID=2320855 RepID=UPI001108CC6F|nr:amino acid ABC transporter permease [Poseidonocella sp. HB161398]
MTAGFLAPILGGVIWTLALSAAALAVGMVLGALLCAMRVSGGAVLAALAAMLILIFRAVPPIVWLFLIYFGLGAGWLQIGAFEAAALGLGLITAANLAEIFRGALKAIHVGQWEAAQTLGLPQVSRLCDVIVPQMLRITLPSIVSYAIGLIKDTAIASTIGVPEIAFQASNVSQATFRGLESFAFAGLLYIGLSIPIAMASRRIDLRLRSKVAR